MKIAVLGAGFTGLSAALKLAESGHQVTVIEREGEVGGLAVGFKLPGWEWSVERGYHHWFTNDNAALSLARKLKVPVVIKRPSTDVLVGTEFLPLDSPLSILTFPHLPLFDRLRLGAGVAYLKLIRNPERFKGKTALPWMEKVFGGRATSLVWEPLLSGKFGPYKDKVSLTWFWARVYKRTPSLAYPAGGFQAFAEKVAKEIEKLGGNIVLNTPVLALKQGKNEATVTTSKGISKFDEVIVTLPSPLFAKLTPELPESYKKKICSIPHLHAQVLILVSKKPFFDKTYWLNITQKDYPFLVMAEHTNFMDPKHYGGQHILYIGNYLPDDHPFLKMSAKQLLKTFDPYLQKIHPNYQLSILNSELFTAPFAQPVVTTDYLKLIPTFKTPLKDVFLANMDMVYPWDRGTNYAIEMGEKVAELISNG